MRERETRESGTRPGNGRAVACRGPGVRGPLAGGSAPVAGRRLRSGLIALALVGAVGCSGTTWRSLMGGPDARLTYTLSLHLLVPTSTPSNRLVSTVYDQRGAAVRVGSLPLLSSAQITAIDVEPDATAGVLTLRVQLDTHGQYVWAQELAAHAGEEVAVLVDGTYRFIVRLSAAGHAPGSVAIRGPWDKAEADKIADRADANYSRLNRGKTVYGTLF